MLRMTTMEGPLFTTLLIGIAVIAFLYSSVGYAGASGYIAVMTLYGLAPTTIRPIALLLNIVVAVIGSKRSSGKLHTRAKSGYFVGEHPTPPWRLGFLLAVFAITGGFFGSYLGSRRFPVRVISLLLAIVLLIAGSKLIFTR